MIRVGQFVKYACMISFFLSENSCAFGTAIEINQSTLFLTQYAFYYNTSINYNSWGYAAEPTTVENGSPFSLGPQGRFFMNECTKTQPCHRFHGKIFVHFFVICR